MKYITIAYRNWYRKCKEYSVQLFHR